MVLGQGEDPAKAKLTSSLGVKHCAGHGKVASISAPKVDPKLH